MISPCPKLSIYQGHKHVQQTAFPIHKPLYVLDFKNILNSINLYPKCVSNAGYSTWFNFTLKKYFLLFQFSMYALVKHILESKKQFVMQNYSYESKIRFTGIYEHVLVFCLKLAAVYFLTVTAKSTFL